MEGQCNYEKCFDMPFGGTSSDKHVGKVFATIAIAVVMFICKVCWRYKVKNRESIYTLADATGAVVVANHTSYLDVVHMYLAMRPRLWPRFMAKSSLFYGKPYIFGWMLAHLGVFPVHRDTADRTAIKRAAKMLKNGEIVCILPEGTRRDKSDRKPELHAGAALIARMGKVPILPMTVRGAEKVKNKGERIRFPQIEVEFGNPIVLSDFDFLPKDKRLDGCTWYAMRESFAMFQQVPPEEVDMVALFPDGEDFTTVFAEHPIPHHTSEEIARAMQEAKAGGEA